MKKSSGPGADMNPQKRPMKSKRGRYGFQPGLTIMVGFGV